MTVGLQNNPLREIWLRVEEGEVEWRNVGNVKLQWKRSQPVGNTSYVYNAPNVVGSRLDMIRTVERFKYYIPLFIYGKGVNSKANT